MEMPKKHGPCAEPCDASSFLTFLPESSRPKRKQDKCLSESVLSPPAETQNWAFVVDTFMAPGTEAPVMQNRKTSQDGCQVAAASSAQHWVRSGLNYLFFLGNNVFLYFEIIDLGNKASVYQEESLHFRCLF
jgi:hypothetical protein